MTGRKSPKGRARSAGDVQNPAGRVKRTVSSQRWLARQLRDRYVADAQSQGYRSRAAFKLIEIDDKFHLLGKRRRVLDLGAAPGGWTQVAVERVQPGEGEGAVLAVDLVELTPIAGATAIVLDLNVDASIDALPKLVGAPVDVVLSDMAPAATGHRSTDHLRAAALAEAAFAAADAVLKPGGAFVAKVMRSGQEAAFAKDVGTRFQTVRMFKPKASRQDSAEIYLVATGFKIP